MKKLVVFYSCGGNTRLLAEDIAISIKADLLELKPEKDINSKGLFGYIRTGWQAMRGAKPPLKPLHRNPGDYDVIFVGTPVWAWKQSTPISTFMEDHMPNGKKVALFCSHEGNSGSTFQNMKRMSPDNEYIGDMEFFAPLKKDRIQTIASAMKWARSLMATVE
ncbi:MAG: flavodoxin [Candidatus Thermoplasmatota archaeon]|nr:flavodoxin [Candidatus Thermoplasmatota archaeon]